MAKYLERAEALIRCTNGVAYSFKSCLFGLLLKLEYS
jgi:hypothetical protein